MPKRRAIQYIYIYVIGAAYLLCVFYSLRTTEHDNGERDGDSDVHRRGRSKLHWPPFGARTPRRNETCGWRKEGASGSDSIRYTVWSIFPRVGIQHAASSIYSSAEYLTVECTITVYPLERGEGACNVRMSNKTVCGMSNNVFYGSEGRSKHTQTSVGNTKGMALRPHRNVNKS